MTALQITPADYTPPRMVNSLIGEELDPQEFPELVIFPDDYPETTNDPDIWNDVAADMPDTTEPELRGESRDLTIFNFDDEDDDFDDDDYDDDDYDDYDDEDDYDDDEYDEDEDGLA